jgi:hypothetical protein
MAIVEKRVLSVKNLLSKQLIIPDYQRSYKWRSTHVNQLLDDVLRHRKKSGYRLGTVVVHQEKMTCSDCPPMLSIVDGQQRLLTLTLACKFIDKNNIFRPKLLDHEFSSPTTIRNLQNNMAVIQSRVKQLSEEDIEELADFLLNKCELICVTLDDLSEAFQFFDSQNARGKELAPYDLLKAFHLREMAENTEQERLTCVESWESEISPDDTTPSLQIIMSNLLYRIRKWTDGEPSSHFTRHNINVFKGVNLGSTQPQYRFTKSFRALDYMVDHYNADSVRHWDQQTMPYPFLIDQTILNGRRFFEYTRHYTKVYRGLFIDDNPQLSELLSTINNYKGRHRVGDHYVRNLFYCAVLYYYDKFGSSELRKAALLCFIWSYRIRLVQQRVTIESIDNLAIERNGIFRAIKNALHPYEVLALTVQPVRESEINGTRIDGLIEMFRELEYVL